MEENSVVAEPSVVASSVIAVEPSDKELIGKSKRAFDEKLVELSRRILAKDTLQIEVDALLKKHEDEIAKTKVDIKDAEKNLNQWVRMVADKHGVADDHTYDVDAGHFFKAPQQQQS